ncbi:PTS system mannose/fructose/sorbose family transporter subunit IID [Shigella flexneri]
MVDTTQTTTEKKLTQSDIRGVFLRSTFRVHGTSNVCRHLGFCSLWYRQFVASTLRTTKLVNKLFAVTWSFNTQPFVAAPILGVTLALEEQRANGADI